MSSTQRLPLLFGSSSDWPRFVACLRVLLAVGALLLSPTTASSQPAALPQPALLPSFNPLCDSNLVPCLDMDDFAAHGYAHLVVLPRTELRDTAAVVPYGVTLGLLGRLAGGISTHYAFWQEGEAQTRRYHGHGPLRLSLSALLWPLLPLRQSPQSEAHDGETNFVPPRHLRVGLLYEHELRIGPFEGTNSLGLLTDLAALRLVATRSFGPIEITASAGALFDWQGRFATGEGAVQLGVYLPFFKALKLYGEALGRGGLASVQDGVTDLARAEDPFRRQGVIGLGLSFRPQARVDLGVSAQRGLGGLAPSSVLLRFAVLSVGRTYQGRAATPIAQLAGDAVSEAATQVKEYLASLPIDPVLDQNCVLLDDDGAVIGRFGKRTPDLYYCEQDGFKVPIDHHLERDRAMTRLCRDRDLKDCLLERHGSEWLPIRRPMLDETCMLRDRDGAELGRWGEPTPDGRCRLIDKTQRDAAGQPLAQERPIGQPFHTDAMRSRVCEDAELTRCFVLARPGETLVRSNARRASDALTAGFQDRLEQRVDEIKESAAALGQLARDVRSGRVTLSTVAETARRRAHAATQSLTTALQHPEKIRKALDEEVTRLGQELTAWSRKPPEEQVEDLASATGGVIVELGTRVAAGTMNGAAGFARGAKKAQRAKDAAEVLPTSRAARREAMRRAGIPTSQQPSGQLRTKAGIQYRYEMHGPEGSRQTAIVTDQTTDRVKGHGPHWEAGWAKDEHERDPLDRLRVRNGKSKVDYKKPSETDHGRREGKPEAPAAPKSPP